MKTKMLTSIIEDRVSRELLDSRDCIVAGISGGADSMLLLVVLDELRKSLQLELHALHINHCIRGDEADADEKFVSAYCAQHDIPFETVRIDVPARAKASGRSEEEEGRMARYEAFLEVAKRHGANKIALAHHRDDLSETVLINLFRGTGLSGLKGIPSTRPLGIGTSSRHAGSTTDDSVTIIRPLLSLTKAEIRQTLEENGIAWVEDRTNSDNEYIRNKIRNELLPFATREINANASGNIARCAEQVAEAEDFIDSVAQETFARLVNDGSIVIEGTETPTSAAANTETTAANTETTAANTETTAANTAPIGSATQLSLDRARLSKLHPYLARRILMLALEIAGGSLKDVGDVHVSALYGLLEAPTGKSLDLPYGVKARSVYEKLQLERNPETKARTISLETIDFQELRAKNPGTALKDLIPKDAEVQWFDREALPGNVSVRTRLEGDYVLIRMPDGSLGKKTVKSLMIDAKLDPAERDNLPLLVAEDHLVLWAPGLRRSDLALINERTGDVLVASNRRIKF